ncbi:MAG TPA: hypothetical protein VFZ59_10510 [Verrucomicrobiae bacterium]|nr:hypothetical protein [Verrucomicrobiae bacterium]
MKALPFLIVASLCAGCSTTSTREYPVRLESDPPGARVFYSESAAPQQSEKKNSYLGETPCVAMITGTRSGYFKLPEIAYVSKYMPGSATFTAEPPRGVPTSNTISFTYRGSTPYVDGDKIPRGIFFDFTK